MNSEFSPTRRDVVTLVIYAAIGYPLLNSILYLLSRFAFQRLPWFKPSLLSGQLPYYLLNLGVSFVFALALLPFVSLIANGVTGRHSLHPLTRRDSILLVAPCIGLILFVTEIPHFALAFYGYLTVSTSVRAYYLQNIISSLFSLSTGFALAFLPAIFGTLRARVRDEESAD